MFLKTILKENESLGDFYDLTVLADLEEFLDDQIKCSKNIFKNACFTHSKGSALSPSALGNQSISVRMIQFFS